MARWRRPYRVTASMALPAIVACLILAGSCVLITNLVRESGPSELILAPVPLAMAAVLWRHSRVGVVVSDHGVRVRRFFETRTFNWSSVARIDPGPRNYSLLGYRSSHPAIWIALKDGGPVETPLTQAAFLAEPVLPGQMARVYLGERAFNAALQTLRETHSRSLSGAPRES
jgi:hypothetical protein